MTGTPSELNKEESRDDLEKSSEEQPPTTTEEPSPEEPLDESEGEVQEKRSRKTGRRKGAPKQNSPKIVARVIALLVLVGIPAALLLLSGRERGKAASKPPVSTTWQVGSEQDIKITLIAKDKTNLSCASTDAIAGKHCEYESKEKKWSKGGGSDDKSTYKPYRLVGNNDPMLIAGLWSEPALQGALPTVRFSAHCKLKIEGKIKKPAVQWGPEDPWYDENFDWPAGTVSNCVIEKLTASFS